MPTEPPLIVKLLAKAEAWQADLDAGRVKNRAALAVRERTSTVRVTQILRLLALDPSIQAWVRALPPGTPARYVAERQLRGIATMPAARQVAAVQQRWSVFVFEEGTSIQNPAAHPTHGPAAAKLPPLLKYRA